jgi:CDGSH-type Zn-finger protein
MPEPARAPVRVWVDPRGPTYIEGPVEVQVDGEPEPTVIDRFRVAICACRRSDRYPLCDGSHRALPACTDPVGTTRTA